MPMIIIMAVVGTIVAVNFVRSKKDERNLAAMKKTTAREAQAKARAKQIVKTFYSQPKVNPTPALHKYGTYQHGNTCFVNLGDGKSQLMTWDEKQNCWIKPFAAEVPTAAPTTAEEQPVAQTGKSYETIIGPDGKEYLAPDWRDIAEKYVKENRRIIEACLFSNENNNCFKITADKLPDKRSWQFIGQKLIDDDDAERYEIVDDGLIIYICD